MSSALSFTSSLQSHPPSILSSFHPGPSNFKTKSLEIGGKRITLEIWYVSWLFLLAWQCDVLLVFISLLSHSLPFSRGTLEHTRFLIEDGGYFHFRKAKVSQQLTMAVTLEKL